MTGSFEESFVAAGQSDASLITVVIVTYGNRHEYLAQVIASVARAAIRRIVVVYNGNFEELKAPSHPLVDSVVLEANIGSAGGYEAGLRRALDTGAEFIFLLDDDNLPADNCIARLLATYRLLNAREDVCLQAFRPNLEWHRLLVKTGTHTLARTNTFGWFHLANERYLLRRQVGGSPCSASDRPPFPIIRTHVACYGGLFLHRKVVEKIGFPDARYFCYYDDIEFTERITLAGVNIYLCHHILVEDIETSWHLETARCHPAFSGATADARIYLDVRNAIFFNRRRITNKFVYAINAGLFWLGILYLAAFRSENVKLSISRLGLVARAVRDGHGKVLSTDQRKLARQIASAQSPHNS